MSTQNWINYLMPKLAKHAELGSTPVNIHAVDAAIVLAFDAGETPGPGFMLRATHADICATTMRFIDVLTKVLQHKIDTEKLPINPPTLQRRPYSCTPN